MTGMNIVFVCHGNICRSPMAECILKYMLKREGITGVTVESRATSRREESNGIHASAQTQLFNHRIPYYFHRARRLVRSDYEKYDLIIGMDNDNITQIMSIIGADRERKVKLMRDFTTHPGEIADPWVSGNFEITYKQLYVCCKALMASIKESNRCSG